MGKTKPIFELFDKVKYEFYNPEKPPAEVEFSKNESTVMSSGCYFIPYNDFEIKPIVAIKEEKITYYDECDNSTRTDIRYYYYILGNEEWISQSNLIKV